MSHKLQKYDGLWTAVVTPFRSDFSVDDAAFEKILVHQSEAKVKGLVIAGTTGEGPTLSVQEKLSLIKKARAFLKNDIMLMAGVGSSNTSQTVELASLAVDAGADSLLVVTPPYNKPSPAGLRLHFQEIANKVKVPICLYHVPSRTGQRLSAEMIADICSIEQVSLVKEASGDMCLLQEAIQASPKTLFLSGDDLTFLPSLSLGCSGLISVISNIFPQPLVDLQDAFLSGDLKKALRLFNIIYPISSAIFCETNPAPIKEIMSELGLCSPELRLPLTVVSEKNRVLLQQMLNKTLTELKQEGYSYDRKK